MLEALKRGSIGIEMGVSVLIGFLIGRWIDGKFGTQPWLTLVFTLLGVAAGFRSLNRLARLSSHMNEGEPDEPGEDDGRP